MTTLPLLIPRRHDLADRVQTYITCFITGPGLACEDTKKFFNEGVMCSSPKETRRQTANLYYAYAVDTLTNLMGEMRCLGRGPNTLTLGCSHVPPNQTYLEPPNGTISEDRLRFTVRLWSCLHPVLDHPYSPSWRGWKASITRSKVAHHVDHHRMFNRYILLRPFSCLSSNAVKLSSSVAALFLHPTSPN